MSESPRLRPEQRAGARAADTALKAGTLRTQRVDEELRRPVGERERDVLAADRRRPGHAAANAGVAAVERLRALHFVDRLESGVHESHIARLVGQPKPERGDLRVAREADVRRLRLPLWFSTPASVRDRSRRSRRRPAATSTASRPSGTCRHSDIRRTPSSVYAIVCVCARRAS